MKLSAAFTALTALSLALAQDTTASHWTPAASLVTPRSQACIASLLDGRILVAGGIGSDGSLDSAELYGPDDVFLTAEPMSAARSRHTCTTLLDGRVLASSGLAGTDAVASAEIYDTEYGQWESTANAPIARWGQTATLLPDGTVLIAGGENVDGPVDSLEIFDPSNDTFSVLPFVLSSPRKLHAAALLPDGRVLIGGGNLGGNDSANDLATTDLIDVFSGTVTAGPVLPEPRSQLAAATLANGLVLLAGGNSSGADLDSTLLFDPVANAFSAGPHLRVARSAPLAIAIPNNGNILILGGTAGGTPTPATDVYDLALNAIVPFGDLTLARTGIAVAAVGSSGDILAVGGAVGDMPVAACGKTSNVTLTSDQPFYTTGQTATLTATWPRKETIDITINQVPIGGTSSSFEFRTITNTTTSQFTYVTTPLQAGRTYTATAVGRDSHDSASVQFICGITSTTTLSVSPLVAAPIRTPIVFTVRIHPDTVINAPIQGIFIVKKDGILNIASTSTTNPAAYHVDSNGDGVATFSATTDLAAGNYNLSAEFLRGGSFIGTSFSTGFQQFTVVKRTPVLGLAVKNGPARILGDMNIHLFMDPAPGLALAPTGFASMSEGGTLLARNPLLPPPALGAIHSSDVILPAQSGISVKDRTLQIHYEGDDVYLPATATFVVPIKGLVPNIFVFAFQTGVPAPANSVTLNDQGSQLIIRMIPAPGVSPHHRLDCQSNCGSADPILNVILDQPAPFHPEANFEFMDDTDLPNGQSQWRIGIHPAYVLGQTKIHLQFPESDNYDATDLPDFTITAIKGVPAFQVASSVTGSGSSKTAVVKVTIPVVQENPLGFSFPPPITPTGSFQVTEGSASLGTQTVSISASTVQILTFSFPVTSGGHTYSVSYSGDSRWIPLTVAAAPLIVP